MARTTPTSNWLTTNAMSCSSRPPWSSEPAMGEKAQRHRAIASGLLGALLLWLALGFGFVQAEEQEQVPGPDDQYTLGAGDVIRIHVFGEPDLSFESVLVGE